MNIINKIIEKDRMLGDLARESEKCAAESLYMAALACLFILIEQALMHANTEEEKLLSSEELLIINKLRDIRNKLYHVYHYALVLEVNGIAHPITEPDTMRLIYYEFSDICFEIVLKLCI